MSSESANGSLGESLSIQLPVPVPDAATVAGPAAAAAAGPVSDGVGVSVSVSVPVVAVFGVSGQQGGAVARALLASKQFRVRGITRNPQSDSAKKFVASVPSSQANALHLVAADLEDEKCLASAFSGVWGVFLVTNFWDPKVGPKESQQVQRAADQAIKAGVKFLAYSSLPDVFSISGGRYKSPHFTGKNAGEKYIRTLPFADGSSFPYAGLYFTNFLHFSRPKKNDSTGIYEFHGLVRSDVAVPLVDIEEEFGAAVLQIFKQPKRFSGKVVYTGKYMTHDQWAEAFTLGTGKKAKYVQLPFPTPSQSELQTADSAAAGGSESVTATAATQKSAGELAFQQLYHEILRYWNEYGYYEGINLEEQRVTKAADPVEFWKKHAIQF